jgi:glycosyltransferase involved in cell wall biosynthesis
MVGDTGGILIEPGNTAAFAKALRILHDDPAHWRRMKRAARERAAQFDHNLWARKFEQICERLVRG